MKNFLLCVLEVAPQHSIEATYNKDGLPEAGKSDLWERDVEEHLEKIMRDPELRFEGYDSYSVVRLPLSPSPLGRLAISQIRKMAKVADCFLNLYDLSDDTAQRITDFMSDNGIAFTGAGGRHYDPTRHELKRVCQHVGVGTAPFSFCWDDSNLEQVVQECGGFPVFVKPEQGFDSVGIDDKSLCVDIESLRSKVNQITHAFGGALVEKYLDGPEYSVLIAGNGAANGSSGELVAYEPVKYEFSPDQNPGAAIKGATFLSFELKYVDVTMSRAKLLEDAKLAAKLKALCVDVYRGFEMSGFARFDVREDPRTGTLCVLDINPNCSVFFKGLCTADKIVGQTPGWNMTRFLHFLLSHALTRQRRWRDNRKYEVVADMSKAAMRMMVLAAQDIQEDELIYSDEMQPLRLVTAEYVEKNWGHPADLEWFKKYAWPAGPDTFVTWHSESAHWRPINHSCDPNCKMKGLAVVGRRAIKKGEELTLDYATFLERALDFTCWCGSSACRNKMALGEYKEAWFQKRYKGQCSPYIEHLMATHPHPDAQKQDDQERKKEDKQADPQQEDKEEVAAPKRQRVDI